MTVRAGTDDLKTSNMSVEARFDDALRYLDSCGAAISDILKNDPTWKQNEINPQAGSLNNRKSGLTATFDTQKLVVGRNSDEHLDRKKADRVAEDLATSASMMYQVATERFQIPNTTRFGMRFAFVAVADSVEEAQQFLVRHLNSALDTEVKRITGNDAFNAMYRYSFEDPDTGIRQNISLHAVRLTADTPYHGFGGEEDQVKGGVVVDVDTYTRPAEGHFGEVRNLVQETFSHAIIRAGHIFNWLRTHQR